MSRRELVTVVALVSALGACGSSKSGAGGGVDARGSTGLDAAPQTTGSDATPHAPEASDAGAAPEAESIACWFAAFSLAARGKFGC